MTDIPMEKYVDKQICALERTLLAKIEAAQRAAEKAEHSVDLRLAGMNEFRAALSDQAATFLTRQESEIWRGNIIERLNGVRTRLDKSEGRGSGMQALWGWIIAGVMFLLALIDRWGG